MFASEHFFVQVSALLLTSTVVIIYYLTFKPFEDPTLQRIEVFNEATQILLAYALMCFCDANLYLDEDEFAFDIGFFSIASGNLLVHLTLLMVSSIRNLIARIKAKCKSCKKAETAAVDAGS